MNKLLSVSIAAVLLLSLAGCGILKSERELAYEHGLPEYLQHGLDAYKDGLKNGSGLLDCLWGELYGSINAAEINDGVITPEHADYLRKKYLFRTRSDWIYESCIYNRRQLGYRL